MSTVTSSSKRFDCTIKDATSPLAVHVKPVDIKGAVCRDHQKCAIARAIRRQRKKSVKWVDVGASIVLVGTGKNTAVRYKLPAASRAQVRYFDENEGAFAPCTVKLGPPPETLALGSRTGPKARSGKSKTKSRKARQARQAPTR